MLRERNFSPFRGDVTSRDRGVGTDGLSGCTDFLSNTFPMKPDKTPLYLPHLKQKRKALRNEPTPAEYKLWFSLRQQKLDGRSFRRQTSIGNYIVDFYCHSEKVIIELDGQGHYELEGQLRDEQRDMRLRELGYTVLRFENKMIFEQPDNVLDTIRQHFK